MGLNAEGGIGWFAAGTRGRVFASAGPDFFCSTNDGATWSARNIDTMATNANCLVVTPAGNVIAAGYEHVVRSTDEGATWSIADSGLTLKDPYGINLVMSPRGRLLFTNQVTGECWISMNEGHSWAKIGLPRTKQSIIRVSASAHGYVFAYIDGVVFRSHEDSLESGGWVRLDSSVYAPFLIRSGSRSEVYGITGSGVVRSADNGDHWGMIYPQGSVSICSARLCKRWFRAMSMQDSTRCSLTHQDW